MMKQLAALAICASALAASDASSSPSDSIVYDPATGNYVLTYDCYEERVITTTIEPHNKVSAAIESRFASAGESIAYGYSVTLGPASTQPLRMITMDPILQVFGIAEPPSQATLQGASADDLRKFREATRGTAPSGWEVINFTNRDGTSRVGWGRVELPPSSFSAGSKQSGFAFSSNHLPGIFPARFVGDGATWNLPCEGPGPGPAGNAVDTLFRNNHLPRFAAAPVIRVTAPFNAIAVLIAVRSHVAQLEQWGLMDGALTGQVGAYLSEAVAKLEQNDKAGASAALVKLRVTLRTKYPSLDLDNFSHASPPVEVPRNPVDDIRKLVSDYDRVLSARVLDFDAEFVMLALNPSAFGLVTLPGGSDTVHSPAQDADGTFYVSWSRAAAIKPSTEGQPVSCSTEGGYSLSMRKVDVQGADWKKLYAGLQRHFLVHALAPGTYEFRVSAVRDDCWQGSRVGSGDYSTTSRTNVGLPTP